MHSKLTKKNKEKVSKNYNSSWYYLIGILILTIIIYSNSINNDFVYHLDDDVYITNNKDIKSFSLDNIESIFSNSYAGLYLPLTMLTYMIEYHFFDLNPMEYHLVNLLLHLINIVLVFILFKKIKPNTIVPAFVALFFAIHPMHVESVSWLSERKDLLYSMFYLLALISYVNYSKKKKNKYYIYTLLLFAMSLLSKPLAVSFAFFPILFDWYYRQKFNARLIIEKLPFFALSLAIGFVTIYFGKTLNTQDTITPEVSWFNRIFFISDAIILYLAKLFAPINLAVYYYYPVNPNSSLPTKYYLSVIFLLIVIVLCVIWIKKSRKNWREIVFGLVFFAIPTMMILHIIPLGRAYAADRYTYLSYIGLFFIAAIYIDRVIHSKSGIPLKLKPFLLTVLFIYVLGFSILTFSRNKDWQDSLSMFTDMIEKYPDRGHPYFTRGVVKYQFGDNKGALADYDLSISKEILNAKVFANRAAVRSSFKDYKGVLEDCNLALQLDSGYIGARCNRGLAYLYLNELDAAYNDFSYCIKADSSNPNYYKSRILVNEKLKRQDMILMDLDKLIELDPSDHKHYISRGDIYYKMDKFKYAANDFEKAIELNPTEKNVYYWLGNAYFNLAEYKNAIKAFSGLISLDTGSQEGYYNRGVCYLKEDEIRKACEDWKKSLILGKKEAADMIVKYCE